MADRYPAYYAVIPATVRYDTRITANAKLLYGEITALAVADGYCWAENNYFAELYSISIRTVKALVKQLEDCGYITTDVIRNRRTNEVEQRRIYINTAAIEESYNALTLVQKFSPPSCKNLHQGGEENCTDIYVNNTSNNNTPYSPPKGETKSRKPKTTTNWKSERFEGFWKFYPRHINRQKAIAAWDKLKPDDELIKIMGIALTAQINSDAWQKGIGIPHPSTWLNNRRWEDEVTIPAPVQADTPSEEVRYGWED